MKTKTIKVAKMFSVALVAMVLASLVGCAKQQFTPIGQTIHVGDKTYDALLAKDRDPWGHDVSTIHLIESTVEEQIPTGCDQMYIESCQPQQQYNRMPQCQCYGQQPCAYARQARLTNTHVVNSNNQGGPGWVNNTMPNAALGTGIAVGAKWLRPARIAGGSASSSSAASAASAAD